MDHLVRDQAILRVAGTLFFVLFFVGTAVWLMFGGKDRFQHQSELPLGDGRPAAADRDSKALHRGVDHE